MTTTNGSFGQQDQYKSATEQYPATSGATDATGGNTNGNNDLSKDEIGWYFVEQYYTTLSRSPEKLHLFYSKRSQFVFGLEAEVSVVSVGRSAIQERIKKLDFQDCKVRVSNVDSQASDENIVIQVIGETSNKSAELKKFVQTFVLAQQPTGYFVLNDIFRYINEEAEEETEIITGQGEATQAIAHEQLNEGVEMPKAQTGTEEPKSGELDAEVIDKKLEETLATPVVEAPSTNGNGTTEAAAADDAEDVSATATNVEESKQTPEAIEQAIEEESVKEPEKPRDPVPSPSVSRMPSTTKAPSVKPSAPAKPMSWANRAAAAAIATPRPVVPVVAPAAKPATSPVTTPTSARAPAAQPIQAPKPAATVEAGKENDAPQQSGWQTAGDHAKRQNRPQSVSGPLEKEGTMGYVRNVTEAVKTEELRASLSAFGDLVYFDINRQKNCAFVEFATTAGYQAAFSANPHQIGGESILVEPRRPKASAYGGSGYNGARGGIGGRGRGGFEQGRPGRGRGEFGANRGRGAPRGRGPSQPAAV